MTNPLPFCSICGNKRVSSMFDTDCEDCKQDSNNLSMMGILTLMD